MVNYNGTVTYADGSTASNVTLLVVQAETGELFLAPPPATGSNAALTLKPIQSIRLDSVAGTLAVLIPEDEWAAREHATMTDEQRFADGHGLGRELFAGMRRNALTAEEGACTWL